MKKCINLILTLVIFLTCPLLSFSSCELLTENETIAGKVVYVTYADYQTDISPEDRTYYVYLTPFGDNHSEDWVMFRVDSDTRMESDFSSTPEGIPELSVGAVVSINFEKDVKKHGFSYVAYKAEEIKAIDPSQYDTLNNPDIRLEYDKEHLSYWSGDECGGDFEVVHVSSVNYPENGYIFYLESAYCPTLERYWFTSDDVIDDEVISMIENNEVGYVVTIIGRSSYPFYNRDIREGYSVKLAK